MSVSHQLNDGYISNRSLAMTFSADGTSHRNINYNSRHVNLKAEDYDGTDGTPKQVTRFLGVMPSLDGTSEQSIKDWEKTLENITDMFNQCNVLTPATLEPSSESLSEAFRSSPKYSEPQTPVVPTKQV